jgi:hypothetical protein
MSVNARIAKRFIHTINMKAKIIKYNPIGDIIDEVEITLPLMPTAVDLTSRDTYHYRYMLQLENHSYWVLNNGELNEINDESNTSS